MPGGLSPAGGFRRPPGAVGRAQTAGNSPQPAPAATGRSASSGFFRETQRGAYGAGSATPTAANAASRSRQLSQRPHARPAASGS